MKCKFCKSENIKKYGKKISNYEHYQCEDCDLEFFIALDENITNELYENDSDYSNDLNISKDYKSLIQWNHLTAYDFISKNKMNSILDIGAYNGFFVKYLINKNMNSYGYDFNTKAVEFGIENYELKDRITTDLKTFRILKFDCITAFEIIEHLESPNDLLEQINDMISDDGYLIISSPNNKMMWRPPLDTPPHHLLRINPFTLANYLELNGFEIIHIYEQMSSFDLMRNYIGLFFRDKNKNSLKGGNFKNQKKANFLKNILNTIRPFASLVFKPIDFIMYSIGLRYISQVIIAKKINEKN